MISFDKNREAEVIQCMKQHGVTLAYLFGSMATNTAGPQSDIDFAVYYPEHVPEKIHQKLYEALAELLHTDELDVVQMNTVESPTLLQAIAFRGRVLVAAEPYLKSGFEKIARDAMDDSAMFRRRSM